MALEDAWVLAEAVAEAPNPAAGLVSFAAIRRRRVERIVAGAARNAWLYHMGGPVRMAGHLAMRSVAAVAPDFAISRYDWLFTKDVTVQTAGDAPDQAASSA